MNKKLLIAIVIILFVLRTVYGLCSEFWFDDEKQIYLIGLKFFTTHQWPYFGPDVVYTNSQIPGALQGLLVGLPLYAISIPEAPFILLNILSFSALCFLAWYIDKRINLPSWLIWIWVLTAPWVLFFGTRVVNPSYVLPFSILFFVSFFELYSFYEKKLVNLNLAAFLIGLSTTCIMQLHLSWLLLLPFIIIVFFYRIKKEKSKAIPRILFCIAGLLLGALTLIPTYLHHGTGGSGGSEQNIVFNIQNIKNLPDVILRFMSFSSFEIPYMLGGNTEERLAIIRDQLWMAPFTIVLLIAGFLQVAFFIISFFIKNSAPEWNKIRWFTFFTCMLIFASFFFSVKGPSSHTFYITLPVSLIYSFYCYSNKYYTKKIWNKVAIVLLGSGVLFHIGLAMNNYSKISLYKDRPKVVEAIQKKDYKILGLRRADLWGHGY